MIGEPLDAAKFKDVLKEMAPRAREDLWADAARAIMTTDTFPKLATRRALVGNVPVTLNGIAKGSGMIAPDMATMLSFIVTDAPIEVARADAAFAAAHEGDLQRHHGGQRYLDKRHAPDLRHRRSRNAWSAEDCQRRMTRRPPPSQPLSFA